MLRAHLVSRSLGFALVTALALQASAQTTRAPGPPASAPPAGAPSPAAAPATALDAAALTHGIVILERAGKQLGLGTVLNGDGRIVAALSSLGGGQRVDARYADGSLVPTQVGHADRIRDLALLVPQNSRHKVGLRASRRALSAPPPTLRTFTPAGSRAVPGVTLATTGPSSFLGGDGKPLPDAIAFTAPAPATSVGSPLLDETGEAFAVLTRACRRVPGAGCTPVLAGTPVTVVRDFLQKVPASAALPLAWIGVQGNADDSGSVRGVRVASARGPALAAGLRAGQDARTADLIVALDGVPVTTPEGLAAAVEDHAVGDVVDLLVFGAGRYRHVTLVVAAAPGGGPKMR